MIVRNHVAFYETILKADDQALDSAKQKILLTLGKEEIGNGGLGKRGERWKRGKNEKRKLVVGL